MKFIFRTLVVTLVMGIVSVSSLVAQKTYTVQSWGDKKSAVLGKNLQELKTELSLTDEQVDKIKALSKENNKQAKSALPTDPKARREANMERAKLLEDGIIDVLTPEQVQKYTQWKAKKKEELKKKREEMKAQKAIPQK